MLLMGKFTISMAIFNSFLLKFTRPGTWVAHLKLVSVDKKWTDGMRMMNFGLKTFKRDTRP